MNSQTNKIVNLSYLILNKIIRYLNDNIDIICFSLVCKRWYNDRDKYLIFNTDRINLFSLHNSTDTNQCYQHFKLPSYYNIFKKSIQLKMNCILTIGDENFSVKYDYFYDELNKLTSIPCNVSDIYIQFYDSLPKDEKEYLDRLLSESQSLTDLNGCSTLKYGLPKSIKSLSLIEFDEILVKGSLPNSLQELYIDDIYQEILPGVLPDGLLSVTLDRYHYEILPGLLPNGLEKLSLEGYHLEIQPGVFPSSLKSLSLLSYERNSIDSTSWEDSIEMKSYFPISWFQAISSLSNLQTLILDFKYKKQEANIFNLKYLSPNIVSLVIKIPNIVLKGTMPTSLKRINLGEFRFKIDEIFPETNQYHLESFEYRNNCFIPMPPNIKINNLSVSGESKQSTIALPSGVRSIFLNIKWSGSKKKKIVFSDNDVTDQTSRRSLKLLRLPTFIEGPPKFELPNTIEYLDIGYNELDDISEFIPSTLKTLVFSVQSNININIPNDFEYEHSFKLVSNLKDQLFKP
ncbi:hypothetical protein PPL_10866 [Heterostelium album PN500]|uniref:F-box domain-containing protein n=1 Tax=Heterostelium pallidum (strain ATCC 26659 / Pp 5 / PN500) TaxID=670386 RepID=D3BS74_HETP5|nr:hypothetical protein PPL_10866 [Heterostelium album PN500]EFA75811.1 hypothetical protein PPL_10866 [Heterostelium album PN500]|eukprot:XP_020427945.1 hypothetical protein PPL_10866 [Heterostelium album PN500]